MIPSYEPHRLVIKHLSVLESAPSIVAEVEKKVFSAIDEKIKEWVESRGDWEGVFNFLDDETSFKPKVWENDPSGDYGSYYELDYEAGEECKHYLSPLLAVVPIKFGIWFSVNASWVTGQNGKVARPSAAWQNYLAGKLPYTKLVELGFELRGASIFLPIRIDSELLADDYPNSLDDALEPVDQALKKLDAAHVEIDALLKAARDYQFSK